MEKIVLECGKSYKLEIVEPTPPTPVVPWEDIRDTMPVNTAPDDPYFLANNITTWWQRELSQITGITIHHTLSHNPYGIADYITKSVARGGKGRPTTEYTYWVTTEGKVFYCVDLQHGCWHDHTGHKNTNVSIGLAGRWDYESPPNAQLIALVDVANYILFLLSLEASVVKGHCDYIGTACPGWNNGGWREKFYAMLNGGGVSYSILTNTKRNPLHTHLDTVYSEALE